MKKIILILIPILIFLLIGCEAKTSAFGGLNDYIIVADSSEASVMEDTLVHYFFPSRNMPVAEPSFGSKFITLKQLPDYNVRKNILIIGSLDRPNKTSRYLNKILPEDFKKSVHNRSKNFTWQNDLYAINQNVLIFVSPNINTLVEDIKKRGPAVSDLLRKKYKEQLKKSMFDMAEQVDLEEYFLKVYGFTVRIQHDYFIALEEQEDGFIWLRRLDQGKEISRDLFIKYYDQADSIELNIDWLKKQRKFLAKKYFRRNEEIVAAETTQKEVYIGSYNTIKLEGTWRTIDMMIGGPLSLYSFYVPEQNRLFIIEASVTAVGRRKTEFVDQLEIIAESFQINKEHTTKK